MAFIQISHALISAETFEPGDEVCPECGHNAGLFIAPGRLYFRYGCEAGCYMSGPGRHPETPIWVWRRWASRRREERRARDNVIAGLNAIATDLRGVK